MSLIDTTYFINDIELSTDNLAVKIQQKIDSCEPEILIKCLGYDLYKKLIASPTTEPYKSLIEGKEYQVNGVWYKWIGLKNASKESLIAYYVWYQFTKSPEYFQSGFRQSNTENSILINPRPKQVDVYNKMCDWIEEMDFFIYNNINDYSTYDHTLIEKINAFNI